MTTPTTTQTTSPVSTANTCSRARVHRGAPAGLTLDLFSQTAAPEPPRLDVPVFAVRLVRERSHETAQVTTPADVARLACELVEGLDREAFFVVALSTASKIIGVHLAHLGTVDASVASPREVYKFALLCNARSVVCFHNHPSGNVEPSRADVEVSRQIKAAGEVVGVPLVDSLVIGYDGHYTSLVERGLL